ncbi:unnamed protein product, partial [marine sediment metagenome]
MLLVNGAQDSPGFFGDGFAGIFHEHIAGQAKFGALLVYLSHLLA